jgi:hypothetical protein
MGFGLHCWRLEFARFYILSFVDGGFSVYSFGVIDVVFFPFSSHRVYFFVHV